VYYHQSDRPAEGRTGVAAEGWTGVRKDATVMHMLTWGEGDVGWDVHS